MADKGVVKIRIVGDADGLDKSLGQANKKFDLLKAGAATLGVGVVAGLGAAAGAVFKFGGEFNEAFNTIRQGTGATGEALEGLKNDFKEVAKDSPASLDDISTAVADLNTRLGITGEPLQVLADQFVDLSRVTGEDLSSNIESVTRVFGDWGVSAEEQSEKLDFLFKTSQATGITVGKLSEQLVKFGAPLRQVGIDMDEAAALFGKWEKEGVNAELVAGSLRIALGKLARENTSTADKQKALDDATTELNEALAEHGEGSEEAKEAADELAAAEDGLASAMAASDVPAAIKERIDAIKNAGTAGEANAIALETFGARAGPDMAAAIREGRFEIDELLSAIQESPETIDGLAEETETLGDKFNKFKNKVLVKLEPLLTKLFDGIMKAMDALTPHIDTVFDAFSNVIDWLKKNKPVLAGVAAALGVVLLGAVIALTAGFVSMAAAMIAALAPFIAIGAAIGAVTAAVIWAYQNWDWFRAIVDAVVRFVVRGVQRLWRDVKRAFDFVVGAIQTGVDIFNTLKNTAENIVEAVVTKFGRLKDRLGSAFKGIKEVLSAPFKAAFNAIADFWNATAGKVSFKTPDWIPKIGGKGFSIPKIPKLAHGGFVTRPTLAVVGDQVDGSMGEHVTTDRQLRRTVRNAVREAISADDRPAGAQVNIGTLQMGLATPREVVEELDWMARGL